MNACFCGIDPSNILKAGKLAKIIPATTTGTLEKEGEGVTSMIKLVGNVVKTAMTPAIHMLPKYQFI
jgi:hypothetical protein